MATTYRVAVLDDYQKVSRPHFDGLDSRFEFSYFDDTLPPYQDDKSEIVSRLKPFQIICTMRERTPFPKGLVNALPNLRLLLTTGTRNLALDLKAFASHDPPISVAGTASGPSRPVDSTTEHIVTLILGLTRNLAHDDANVKAGGWQTTCMTAVSGKTLGLVGLGRLGASVAKIMHIAFGVKIVAWSENLTQEKADEKARQAGIPVEDASGGKTFKAVSREELFSTADIVSIHLILSDRSRGLITSSDLARMKPSSFFLNTSRGPLVVEEDLLYTLQQGKIRGAALDVFDREPLTQDSPWRSQDWGKDGRSRVLLTPHTAYVEETDLDGWYGQQAANLKRWLEGEALANPLT